MFKRLKDAIRYNYGFWFCLICSALLMFGGAITPPRFVIDKSIFIAVGELFMYGALGALYKALDAGTKASLKKGDIELTVGDDDKEEETQK